MVAFFCWISVKNHGSSFINTIAHILYLASELPYEDPMKIGSNLSIKKIIKI